MAISFPTSLDNFTNPLGTQTLDSPDHAGQHSDANDALEALEAKIGVGAGTPTVNKILVGSGNGTAVWNTTWNSGTIGTAAISASTIGTSTITGGTINTAVINSPTLGSTPVLDSTSAVPFYGDNMARQAIINGNFDVWQRGTSFAVPANGAFTADHYINLFSADGGTEPTLTHSKQTLSVGDIYGSYYYYRINTNGAGSGYGNSSFHAIAQRIEHGTRYLAGNGKTVTLSFYAKSDIANKKIGISLTQEYGTGGSPTSQEIIKGGDITLTSSWVKYTVTFTTNTLVGKTFGTVNDDYLMLWFFTQWGSTIGNNYIETSLGAETYVGSGNIEIAQIQLCSGGVALPFQSKSYEDELRSCKRYCYRITSVDNAYTPFASGLAVSSSQGNIRFFHPVEMRTAPTCTISAAGDFLLSTSTDTTGAPTGFSTAIDTRTASTHNFTGASGLAAGNITTLFSNNKTTAWVQFSAEL